MTYAVDSTKTNRY